MDAIDFLAGLTDAEKIAKLQERLQTVMESNDRVHQHSNDVILQRDAARQVADDLVLERDTIRTNFAELQSRFDNLALDMAGTKTSLQDAINAWHDDLQYIASALRENAIEQEWCQRYEDEVDRITGKMNERFREMFHLAAQRERKFSVTVPVTYYVTFDVSASDEVEAVEQAHREQSCKYICDMDEFDKHSENVDWENAEVLEADY